MDKYYRRRNDISDVKFKTSTQAYEYMAIHRLKHSSRDIIFKNGYYHIVWRDEDESSRVN